MFKKYKAIILAAFLVILFGILPNNFTTTVKAADSKAWINVGTPGLLSGIYPKLFIADGTPYVVVLSGNKIAVMKYNGSTWEKLGNIPTVGNDMGMSLYVYNGIPYVSFCDCGGGSEIKVSVMKYNNGNWESIGTPNFSSQYVNETSICVYGGVPYVTFIDNRQNITLEKYDGGKWQTVGGAQFAKASSNSTLAIYNGIPYVAFRSGYDGTGKLMKFDKGSWQTVGNSSILPAPAYPSFLSLAIDSDGTPYVSFTNESTNVLTVKKFNGSSWVTIGNASSLGSNTEYSSISVYNGTPYVAFNDNNNGGSTVIKYNGTAWETVGSAGLSVNNIFTTALSVYNGTPYVAFCTTKSNLTVMKYSTIEPPTASPASGTVSSGTLVTLTSSTPGADIYYTLDGTPPTVTRTHYTSGITINAPVTIRAIAAKDGIPSASMSATYKVNSSITPTSSSFDKYSGSSNYGDINVTMTLNGNTLASIKNGTTSLTAGTDYVVSGSTVTIKKEYLKGLANGTVNLTFSFNVGNTQSLNLTIKDTTPANSSITATSSSFDKYSSSLYYADINVNMTLNGNTLANIKNGTTFLSSGRDYTVSGSSVTIKKEYLKGLANGTVNLTFCFNAGNTQSLNIAVSDSTPASSSITPTSSSFDKYSGSLKYTDINVDMTLNGNTLASIKNGTASLSEGTDYVATGSAVTIKKEYLEGLATGTANLTFCFNAGANQPLNITISDTTPGNSSITATSSSFDKYLGSSYYTDINVDMTLNGNTLSSIKNGDNFLREETDYVTTGSAVTIKKEYLEGLATGATNLIFCFNAGANQSLNITVSDTTPDNSSITPTSSSFDKYSGSLNYGDMNVTMTLNGNTLSDIKNGGTSLTAGIDYVVSGSFVTIKKEYLERLATRAVNLTFCFNTGTNQSLNITVSDTTPGNSSIAATNSSFDKYLGSSYYTDINVDMTLNGNILSDIKNEGTSLTAGTDYLVSGSTVTIKKEYLEGLATGTVNLTFCFNAGTDQSLNITVSDTTPGNSIITPFRVSFNKYSNSSYYTDINVDMTLNGNTLSDIKNGATSLTAGTDYLVSGSTVTIKKEYLKGLATGTVILIFDFSSGDSQMLLVAIGDSIPASSSITPTSSSFDKYPGSSYYTDINVDMTLNGDTLASIKNGAAFLSAGTDYVTTGSAVTIKKEYLKGLATGTVNLTFSFNAGSTQSLNITVSDTAPGNSSITPTSSSFDKYSGSSYYTDINVDMMLNGDTLASIKNGATFLSAGTDYVTTGSAVTIKKEYLKGLATGTVNLTFSFNAGSNQSLSIAVSDTAPGNSSITPTSSRFDKYSVSSNYEDINVTMTLNGNTLSSIKNGATFLSAGTDYVTTGSAVTIKKEYLKGLATGTVNLTFSFNAGSNQSLSIAVSDSTPTSSSITPTSSRFDKYSGSSNYGDINVTMTLNGNTLANIKNGINTLVNGTDYVVSGNIITIKKSYLTSQSLGNTVLTFTFSSGNTQTMTLSIVDTTVTVPNNDDNTTGGGSTSGGSTSGGGSAGGGSTTTSTTTTTETRTVDVVAGTGTDSTVAPVKVEITRTVESGTKVDTLKLDEAKVTETIAKAVEANKDVATVLVTELKGNPADLVEVQVPKISSSKLADSGVALKIEAPKATVQIPSETLKSLGSDVKITMKEVTDVSKINDTKALVLKTVGDSSVVGNPVEVETNFSGRTEITIPLKTENLPKDPAELKKVLDSLAVQIHHSDGENATEKGTIVYDEKGNPIGISIWVDKFSTFTVIELSKDGMDKLTANNGLISDRATQNGSNKGNSVDKNSDSNVQNSQLPEIKFVGLGHSPLVEGDKEDFIISSGYEGNVQYRIYLNVDGVWQEVTNGYSAAVSGKDTFTITPDYAFKKGQYQGRVYVKKAGATGNNEEAGIDFDNYYTYNINCVDRDDANRVYTVGNLEMKGLNNTSNIEGNEGLDNANSRNVSATANINVAAANNNFKAGQKIIITGIEGISGIPGPYYYRLHIYDVANDKWTNNIIPYSEKLEWTPTAAGTYVLDIHVITPNSVLWDKVQEDPTVIYGGYEGWKLKAVRVNN